MAKLKLISDKALRAFYENAGNIIVEEINNDIIAGKNGQGRKLEPVQKWTRRVTGFPTSGGVLNRTTGFRRSHKIRSISKNGVKVGPTGKYRSIATKIKKGGVANIRVQTEKPSGALLITDNSGRKFTKAYRSRLMSINVPARNYGGVSKKALQRIIGSFGRFARL